MKLKITVVSTIDIDDSIYQDWMNDQGNEEGELFCQLSTEDKLKVIRECEEECGYEILDSGVEQKSVIIESNEK